MKLSQPQQEYTIFTDELDRLNVFDACKRAADFAVDKNVGNMVFIDRAARPMSVGVREYYRLHYPDNDMPGMFFVNPDGFYRPIASIFNPGIVKKRLEKKHPHLLKRKNEPTMVVDTCIHSGESSLSVVSGLIDAGFDKGYLTMVDNNDNYSEIVPYTTLLHDRLPQDIGCYTFGKISQVKRTGKDVISRKRKFDSKGLLAEYCRTRRQEIKQIIHDYSNERPVITNYKLLGNVALEVALGLLLLNGTSINHQIDILAE